MQKLAVILPIYNAEQFLKDCLDSLFQQTFKDFFVIAMNDASSDRTQDILDNYAKQEDRLKVYHFDKNKGDPGATQFALNLLNNLDIDYVARMDADDICLPQRFEKQIAFLDEHPEIDVVGTNTIPFTPSGETFFSADIVNSDEKIKTGLITGKSPIANPTSMWRHSSVKAVNLKYDVQPIACDYAMWVELAIQGKKFANLKEPLLRYRLHAQQASNKVALMKNSVVIILTRYIMALFSELNITESSLFARLFVQTQFSVVESQLILATYEKLDQTKKSVLGEDRELVLRLFTNRVNGIRKAVANYRG